MAKREHGEHRFNVVDLLIILVLAFVIGVLIFVMLGNDILSVTSDKTQVNYSLFIKVSRKNTVLCQQLQIKYYFCILKSNTNESTLDNTPSDSVKRIHDIRLVWAPQAPGDEDLHKLAADPCHPVLMGRGIS